jgi:phosphoglycerate dehydrogenase-like enzyme
MTRLTIYCNAELSPSALSSLSQGVAPHALVAPEDATVGVLEAGEPDPKVADADIVFGQPDVGQIIATPRVAWVHLSSAGYTRYDRDDLREALVRRGATLTKSSRVFDEPCALHILAFMCAEARQLGAALDDQRGTRPWRQAELRAGSRLLRDQAAVLVGFGSIGQRLVELLAPHHLRLSAIRRRVVGDEPIATFASDDGRAARALAEADHVIDLLPESRATETFFDRARLAALKQGARFYNVGRGSTVDQEALRGALVSGHLAAAYLDVTTPEPLPAAHPLWSTPRCFITPHTAGGNGDEGPRLVRHFLDNLARFTAGEPLLDRVV